MFRKIRLCIVSICAVVIMSSASSGQAASETQIVHQPLLCAAKDVPIDISLEVISSTLPRQVRVYFREQGMENFYFIRAVSEKGRKYTGRLPVPMAHVIAVEYLLLVLDEEGPAVKSPIIAMPIEDRTTCPHYQRQQAPGKILVFAEQDTPPEIGFSGEHVVWTTSGEDSGGSCLHAAEEKLLLFEAAAEERTENQDEQQVLKSKNTSRFGKKTMIGVGAGAGALALIGAVAAGGGGSDGGGIWDDVGGIAENVIVQLQKSPAIQISCGTVVTNQLFVTNNRSEDISLGTVDYQVILTTDNPAGSCEAGRSGAFAPTGAATIRAGETVLIRQWSNEVNPCSGCPYFSAECVWQSRYIAHTSAGSAAALSTFSAQGDLCGSAAKKPFNMQNQLQCDE